MEVCLVGLFGREYRKLASAVPAGLGLRRRQKGSRREAPGRGERRMGAYREFSMSIRVAPVPGPSTPGLYSAEEVAFRWCHNVGSPISVSRG